MANKQQTADIDVPELVGRQTVEAWNQQKVTKWLDEKGWGHFASTFEKHNICHDKFFSITLAELVRYLPRTMTTYYERRRLLNEIRSLIPPAPGQPTKPTPSTPANISINTNVHEYCNDKLDIRLLGAQEGGVVNSRGCTHSNSLEDEEAVTTTTSEGGGFLSDKSPFSSTSSINLAPPLTAPAAPLTTTPTTVTEQSTPDVITSHSAYPTTQIATSTYSNNSSNSSAYLTSQQYYYPSYNNAPKSASSTHSSSPTPSPSSEHHLVLPFTRKHHKNATAAHSPTRLSPKAAFYKIKDKFHRSHGSSTTSSPPSSSSTVTAIANAPPTTAAATQRLQEDTANLNLSNNSPSASCRVVATAEQQQRHPLLTSTSVDDIGQQPNSTVDSPSIPARVSSTPDKISKFWATYKAMGTTNNNNSSNIQQQQQQKQQQLKNLYSSTISNSVPLQYQSKKTKDQKIQITMDLETWYSLNVTNIRDPVIIKRHILQRLNFQGDYDQYLYFHENGPNPDIPMDPQSLMCLCANADNTASQRIFVKPLSPDQESSYHFPTPALGYSPSMIPPSHQKDQQQQPQQQQQQPYSPAINNRYPLINSRPLQRNLNRRPGIKLYDPSIPVHPYTLSSTTQHDNIPNGAYQRKHSDPALHHSEQLWPPSVHHPAWSQSEPELAQFNRPALQEVGAGTHTSSSQPPPLSSSSTVPSSTTTTTTTTTTTAGSSSHGLWAVAPHPHTPTFSIEKQSRHQHNTTTRNNELFWGERPPAEIVFQHMEHYFDSRDLDKEIVIEEQQQQQQTPVLPSPRTQRRQTRKSIRLVAREASKKYNPDYFEGYYLQQQQEQQTASALTPSASPSTTTSTATVMTTDQQRQQPKTPSPPMLRRKSTKLWGTRVVELKSRSAHVIARLPSVSEHMRLVSTTNSSSSSTSISSHHQGDATVNTIEQNGSLLPTATTAEVQWIRGKLIGKGSFGRVYLAFNVVTGEMIAVKQVEIPKTASDLLNVQQHDMVEALFQEIMMLRDLDHENIVQYLGYGRDDDEGMINIFLEYVSGGSVASRLALHGAFDEQLTRYFSRQITAGLEYLHSKHILHRDIKAANILVEADGVCKISDFGLSKKNDYEEAYDQNSRMSLRGSVYWMAPEVVKNEPYSAKVDIWSLGCTVLEMLTGQRPWISMNQIAALYNLGKLNTPTIPDHISECAKDFLAQCFTIDPSKRPTAAKLLTHEFLRIDPSFDFKEYVERGKV